MEFDARLPIKNYAPFVASEFSDLAAYLHDDLLRNKHKSGAIENGYEPSPSGYQRMVLSSAPFWYSELYWTHNWIEKRPTRPTSQLRRGGSKRKRGSVREVVYGPIRRPRVISALVHIRERTDLATNLHSIMREHLFSELTQNSWPIRDYFDMNGIETPFEKVPIEAYGFDY